MKWEYWVTTISERELSKGLNEAGAQGWELIHLEHHYDSRRLVFKRPVYDPAEAMCQRGISLTGQNAQDYVITGGGGTAYQPRRVDV